MALWAIITVASTTALPTQRQQRERLPLNRSCDTRVLQETKRQV